MSKNLIMTWSEDENRGMIKVEIDEMKKFFTTLNLSFHRIAAIHAYVDSIEIILTDLVLAEVLNFEKNQAPACAWARGEMIRMLMFQVISHEFDDLIRYLELTQMSSGGFYIRKKA